MMCECCGVHGINSPAEKREGWLVMLCDECYYKLNVILRAINGGHIAFAWVLSPNAWIK